jgi:preprotein translocase subunit YajC
MIVPFASLAMAAALQTAPGRPSGGLMLGIQVILILAIFYFMMIRPQQKQRKRHESTLMSLKKGEDIVTAGGIIGRVVHIKEGMKDGAPAPSLQDAVTIQSAETRIVVERGRISRVGTTSTAARDA